MKSEIYANGGDNPNPSSIVIVLVLEKQWIYKKLFEHEHEDAWRPTIRY